MANVQDIYNEINRIGVAKNGIAGAIEEKGVDVPAEAKIDEYPELVRQIQQGSQDAVLYTPQDLTPAQKQQARTNIGATAPEIFWAEYGVTSYSDIVNEVNSGKVVALLYGGRVYIISQTNFLDSVWFIADAGTQVFRIRCTNTDQWTQDTVYVEITGNKSQSVPNDRANTAKYPSVKAVADALGKWGVVSQTQTWTGSNETGWTAVISDPVYGLIPQANIDLYVAAGAVFNPTTGYFELNGLTDISYEEMRNIYEYGKISLPLTRYKYAYLSIRTTLPQDDRHFNYASASDFSGGFAYTDVEIIRFGKETSPTSYNVPVLSKSQSTFTSSKTKDAGTMKLTQTGEITIPCISLERIHIFSLNADITFRSSRLRLESIVFLVDNAGNGTKSVIVTLHATAYARCQADTTEYTYQGNTYVGILAYASAKNITIASA